MLVQQVYNLDPDAFPLDKPTEKSRRIKGRKSKESEVPIRSISEDPSKLSGSNLGASAIAQSPPADSVTIHEQEFDNKSQSAQSESAQLTQQQQLQQRQDNRIKRAYSDADLFVRKDLATEDFPETSEDQTSLRFRTRSGSSLPQNHASTDNNGEKYQCEMSETASLTHDWNPALIGHDGGHFVHDDSLDDANGTAQSPDRESSRNNSYAFDSNSVILRSDNLIQRQTGAFCPEVENCDDTTVMAGGRRTGWSADVAYVLWKRILGILGDVNEISDPEIHARVFSYLHEQFDVFYRVRENLGVSLTNTETPPPPTLVPPLYLFVPWCLGAFQLSSAFHDGKLLALELLCRQFVISSYDDYDLGLDSVSQFYQLLRWAMTETDDDDFLFRAVKSCAGAFFRYG